MSAVALFGGGAATGLAALFRIRGQGRMDSATARKTNAEAESIQSTAYATLTKTISDLSDEMRQAEADNKKAFNELEVRLQSDIEAKDIRLKRLESDVVTLKQKLGEWRAYAMGLYHMLVALRPDQTPPPPPDTGPLKT